MSVTMLWGDRAIPEVQRCFERAKAQAERNRRIDAQRRRDILEDDWHELLTAHVRTLYEWELFSLVKPHISTEHNVLRRIATELSQVYKWGAVRELDSKRDNDVARLLWHEVQIDEKLEAANLFDNVLRDNILFPWVDDGKMHLQVLTPDRYSVIQHPRRPWEAIAFWFDRMVANTFDQVMAGRYQVNAFKIERVLVDAEFYRVFDEAGKLIEEVHHGIGRIPAVVVHNGIRDEFFFCPRPFHDVVEANYSVGWLLAMVGYLQKMQGELQPTYEGDPDEIAQGLQIGAHNVWAGRGRFGTVDFQASPDHYLTQIRARIGLIAQSYGLSADAYEFKSSITSGFQFRLQRIPLLEQRKKQTKKWKEVIEPELYLVMALVAQRFHPILKPDPAAKLHVAINDIPFIEDPKVENEIDEQDVGAGRTSQVRVLMRRHGFTREEAESFLKQVLKEKGIYAQWAQEFNAPADGTPGKSPQENGREGGIKSGVARGGRDVKAAAAEALKRMREAG